MILPVLRIQDLTSSDLFLQHSSENRIDPECLGQSGNQNVKKCKFFTEYWAAGLSLVSFPMILFTPNILFSLFSLITFMR